MPFIPHTPEDIKAMLQDIGENNIEQLFDEIPPEIHKFSMMNVPPGVNECDVSRIMVDRAPFHLPGTCFIGAGAYEHYIPHVVWQIAGRGEYYTAYTPYQSEASQGNLQLIFEYQTMMANLMATEVSNASLYDGASALAEAVLMAVRIRRGKTKKILVPKNIHPHYVQVLKTILPRQHIELIEVPLTNNGNQIDGHALTQLTDANTVALIIPQPNFFGGFEEVDRLTNWASQNNLLTIGLVNPIAMSVLKPPGEWGDTGADIICGEGQPLGVPLSSGGPYFGFLCCKKAYVRQMPGRLVGETVDSLGKRGYTLTLQAREQHIRRGKATSNICTNQGLVVVAATIYMSLLGYDGLREVALQSHKNAEALFKKLTQIPCVRPRFSSEFFHEFVIQVDGVSAEQLLNRLNAKGIQGGLDLSDYYPEYKNCILICVTETKSEQDIERYCQLFQEALNQKGVSKNAFV